MIRTEIANRYAIEQQTATLEGDQGCGSAATTKNPNYYCYRNLEFHAVLAADSYNKFLRQQVITLRRRLARHRRMQHRVSRHIEDLFDEHQRSVDAIVAGQEHEIEWLLKGFVMIQGERFREIIPLFAGTAPV